MYTVYIYKINKPFPCCLNNTKRESEGTYDTRWTKLKDTVNALQSRWSEKVLFSIVYILWMYIVYVYYMILSYRKVRKEGNSLNKICTIWSVTSTCKEVFSQKISALTLDDTPRMHVCFFTLSFRSLGWLQSHGTNWGEERQTGRHTCIVTFRSLPLSSFYMQTILHFVIYEKRTVYLVDQLWVHLIDEITAINMPDLQGMSNIWRAVYILIFNVVWSGLYSTFYGLLI